MKVIQSYEKFLPSIGGAETYIANLVENIKDIEFEIITSLLPNTDEKEAFSQNCNIVRLKPVMKVPKNKFDLFREIIKDIIRARKRNAYLKKCEGDLVHIHAPSMLSHLYRLDKKIFKNLFLSRLLLYKKIRKPVIATIHQLYYQSYDIPFENDKFKHKFFRNIIEVSDAIIAVEHYSYNYLKSYLEKYNIQKRLYKIHNCIDTNKFAYKDNKIGKKLKLLYVGRLTSEKGTSFLFDFIKNLPEYIKLEIVGSGSEDDFKLFENLILKKENISLYKNVSLKKLIKLYQNCNLVLNPVKFQAITRVTLEAMSCGKPVIMIKRGNRHPVIYKKTGYLIKENLKSLLKLLEAINKNRNELIQSGRNARKIIEQEFSNKAVFPKIKKVYEELLENER